MTAFTYLDTFTLYLRYAIFAFLASAFLCVWVMVLGTMAMHWQRRWELKHRRKVYDWMIDGGVDDEDDDEDWHQHVRMIDRVPPEWTEQWR